MKLNEAVFKRWKAWSHDIQDDLVTVVDDQQTFYGFSDIVQSNWRHIQGNHGRRFCHFVRRCYGIHAAVAIRRHLKIDSSSISLMQLLDQLKKCASQFTYDFYISQYPLEEDELDLHWQEGTFSMFSHDGKTLADDIIDDDMNRLLELGKQVESYVDRQVAHLDRRDWDGDITYDDLKAVLDKFNEVTCRYLSLILTSGLLSLEPVIQYDWKQIFQVPLNVTNHKDLTSGSNSTPLPRRD